jgi:hypothetical protein
VLGGTIVAAGDTGLDCIGNGLLPQESEMQPTISDSANSSPLRPIRRFDVFAEYTRQERLKEGYPQDEAKGYGIWLAKVVAARRFGKKADGDRPSSAQTAPGGGDREQKFRSVGDELQTDETFDQDIVDRMGAEFYDDVFVPAIAAAIANGKRYEEIRDTIRKDWKSVKPGTKSRPAR